MPIVRTKNQCKRDSPESCSDDEEEMYHPACEKPFVDKSFAVTVCDYRGIAELTKNYVYTTLNNVPVTNSMEQFLYMLREAKLGPGVNRYHPHLVGRKPHCQSYVETLLHFNYVEVHNLLGYFLNLPNNTDWNIQIIPTQFDLAKYVAPADVLSNLQQIVPKDLSLVQLKFVHIPFTACKGEESPLVIRETFEEGESSKVVAKGECDENDFLAHYHADVELPKCQEKPEHEHHCEEPEVPVTIPFLQGPLNAHVVGKNLVISEADVVQILADGPGLTIIFKPCSKW